MAVHWQRDLAREASAGQRSLKRAKLAINALGAAATGIALAVILAAKFLEGAWVTVLVIPAAVGLLWAVRHYYDDIDRQVLSDRERLIDFRRREPPIVIVPIKRWDRLARKALEYAIRLSPDVTALHVTTLEGPDVHESQAKLRRLWRVCIDAPARRRGVPPPALTFANSEYRSMTGPVLREIERRRRAAPARAVTVILPELVDGRWWGYAMHVHRERRLRARLLRLGVDVVVSTVPWHLQDRDPAQAIADEEGTAASS
jgi:hypothetical protein